MVSLNVNGKGHQIDVPADMPVLWVLRDVLGMTGTKFGCGMALCGACTVQLDGQAIRSCVTPVSALAGKAITTIEAIGDTSTGKKVQEAWIALDVTQAVRIAKQVDAPVKVVWSREEDVQHDVYRPYYYDRIAAGLGLRGAPVAWTHRIVGPAIIARYLPPAFKDGVDIDVVDGAVQLLYDIPAIHVEHVRHEEPVLNTGFSLRLLSASSPMGSPTTRFRQNRRHNANGRERRRG